VKRFLEVKDSILKIRSSFREAVRKGGIGKGSPQYEVARSVRDSALAVIRRGDRRVYAAAVKYLDEIQPKYEDTLHELARLRRAEELTYSVAGRIGRALEPVLKPLGFDWRIATALIGAMAAKEVFVAQLGIVFSVGEADESSTVLREKLRRRYTPLVGFCIMLFCLITCPCVATLAVTKSESESWGWMLFQMAGLTGLAYVVTLVVYQIGSLLKIGVG